MKRRRTATAAQERPAMAAKLETLGKSRASKPEPRGIPEYSMTQRGGAESSQGLEPHTPDSPGGGFGVWVAIDWTGQIKRG